MTRWTRPENGTAEEALYMEPSEDDEGLEEVYAAHLDAWKKFAEVKAARGFYPVVALAPRCQSPSPLPRVLTPKTSGSKLRRFR